MFGVPPQARRAKPFIDHILSFSLLDGKIWFRNFQVSIQIIIFATHSHLGRQIIEKDPLQPSGPPKMSLVEIGPRFVLTPIRIFEGAFSGATVFSNPGTSGSCFAAACIEHVLTFVTEFISPAAVRSAVRREQGDRYRVRKEAEQDRASRREGLGRDDELAVAKVFA
jgi:ribosome biogenesis protein BRX1